MSRSNTLLQKSISACISAIEIYNKPDFKYREETFSILMINSWELLLKAKILKDNKGNINSIYVKTPKILANQQKSKKLSIVKTTRSGNPMTIELLSAIDQVSSSSDITLAFRENIIALCEIRDNAIHFINEELTLSQTVLELGTASLKNYLNAVKNWFNKDLTQYNFYLMPLSFFHDFGTIQNLRPQRTNFHLENLLNYIGERAKEVKSDPKQDYNLLLKIDTKFVKSSVEESLIVKTINSQADAEFPDQVQEVILTEEDVRQRYRWTHEELCERLKKRYIDFKQGPIFYRQMKELKQMKSLCYMRLLNPSSVKSARTYWYSPNCINLFFDKFYSTGKVGYATKVES